MAEIRCPSCGKDNPDSLDVCRYCQTPLLPPSGAESGSGADDWLDSLRSGDLWQDTEAPQDLPDPQTEAFDEDEGADFFASPGGESGEEALPDWLKAAAQEEGGADFLARLESEPEEEPLPDWLREFGAADLPQESAPSGGQDLPDWLAEPGAPPPAVPDEPEKTSPGEPDWLEGFVDASTDAETGAGETEIETEWLAGFVDETPAQAPGRPGSAGLQPDQALSGAEDDELPAWLEEFNQEQPAPEAEEDIPAWLASALGQVQLDEPAADQPFVDTGDLDVPSGEPPAEESVPEWLSGLESAPEELAPAAPVMGEGIPDWLKEYEEPGASAQAAQAAEEQADIPDWLQELHDRTPEPSSAPAAPDADRTARTEEPDALDWFPGDTPDALGIPAEARPQEDLAPGELPDWLKAMRLAEASSPGAMEAGEIDTGALERIGPLAGLRGVLSAEPVAAQAGKTPGQTIRLNVSDLQQKRADQLQKMITAETEPRAGKRPPVISEQRVLRILIALLLFLAAVLPAMVPGRLSSLPPVPVEMERLNGMIAGLSPDSVVLVAFEYQPGMSGELDAAAAGVLDHILLQGARLALVSGSPTGPALGERFLQVVVGSNSYPQGVRSVNLGYIPGDATGLQAFARAPQSTVRMAYDAVPAWNLLDAAQTNPWNDPDMSGVNELADFQMTILLSDDPDTIRRWIEQVEPSLLNGSLVVIASAQAEPLVRPYLTGDDAPVAVLVPGLSGGAAYEGFTRREAAGRAAWDAVGIGALVAVTLVLGTGAYNLFLAWNEREAARRGRGA